MNWAHRSKTAALVLACGVLSAAPARAQSAPVLLLLDQNAIAANQTPNMFAPVDINATIAAVGVRDPLPFFMKHEGQNIVLPGGPAGHEGWFAPATMSSTWNTASGANDAPQNFILAGPGLGSPDASASRTTLLGNVQSLSPLGASRLQALVGRTVCAVVFSGEIPWTSTGTSLKTGTLGTAAFSIVSVTGTDATRPSVTVFIVDFDDNCGGALSLVSF
jgi:hypothetical protein